MIKFIQIEKKKNNQIPTFPRPFGWISKLGLINQLRFDKVSIPNFSPTVWMNFQARSDYPITTWQSVKSQFFPDRLDEFPRWVWLSNCDLTKCQIQFFPDHLDGFPNRV